jgi:hypothetical protein
MHTYGLAKKVILRDIMILQYSSQRSIQTLLMVQYFIIKEQLFLSFCFCQVKNQPVNIIEKKTRQKAQQCGNLIPSVEPFSSEIDLPPVIVPTVMLVNPELLV